MRNLLCAALITLATALPAHAGNLLDLAVVDRDDGRTLPTYAAGGKLYVAGTPGPRYAVRMANRSSGRILVVLSVDGVNAVSGQTADVSQTGYVLDPWQSTEINGWRKSLDEIAQFNFTALSDSYAAATGRPANVGVIGVAVFNERVPMPPKYVPEVADARPLPAPPSAAGASREGAPTTSAAPAASAAQDMARAPAPRKAERLGTGHGEREYAHVDRTTFERATRDPAETISIWYDSQANLVARGIIPRPRKPHEPQAFPNSFVPDPPRH
ncbi:hypothetical protein [Dokdonella sp.]|uniref:hypothetical protein n=1 Tax=Dokdonella sp. TaxID=2291710 RepID=UPI0027B8D690|nr:hypothetical protein [Dokdonella sp.]